ncbi:MAG: hypothetical protein OXE96_12675 [Gemmatimonadetes bacterium]|nr:hypothetical protein [Gemmatimonadota bacterium]
MADFYDSLPGSDHATNPLLRAPGALILNDGECSDTDMEGIRTFADSTKSHDSSRAGKFGIGQKAVFHLCDAFVVVANAHRVKPSWQVVNPFVSIKNLRGNVTEQWEELPPADRRLLADRFETVAWKRCLGIWIPFRNANLHVAPQAGFSTTTPCLDAIAESWNRPGELRTLLTMLRHLREVAIRREGKDLIALRVNGSAKRLSLVAKRGTTGIDRASGHIVRRLHGTIQRIPDGRRMQYVGREALLPNHHLCELKDSKYWPHSHTAYSPAPRPEKGEPHGAISLWCDPRSQASELSISWAVFLPVSDEGDTLIPIKGPPVGRVRLLLHGYFFLDSGRQRIYGIDGSCVRAQPIDEAETRHAWNAGLCNSVVLPLLPRVLHDALENRVLRPNALRSLLMGFAGHDWFRQRRSAICRKHALVCALEPTGSRAKKPKWQLCSTKSKLRPLPNFVAQNPRLLAELFPEAHAFAASHEMVLCTHVDASLIASEMSWSADELNELFSSLQAHVFNRRLLIGRLAEFLRLIESDNAALLASVTGQVVGVLRRALVGRARLVEAEQIASVLGLLPDTQVRVISGVAPNRRLLRVLAESESAVLIVPEAYMPNASRRVDKDDLKALLKALEPEVRGVDSEAASRTALALIQGYGDFSAIASDPIVESLAVLRGRRVRTASATDGEARGETVILSIKAIRHRVARGLLFAGSPDANTALPILADAIPEISPVIVDQRIAKFLTELAIAELVPRKVDKRSLCRTVREAADYGPAVARRQLIECLPGMPGSDDRQVVQALRCLCAGAREAADPETRLYYLEGGLEGLERVIRVLLENDPAAFLVHPEIISALPPRESTRLSMQAIGAEYFDRVAQNPSLRAALVSYRPTRDERAIFLRCLDSDETLRSLPIFARTNGTVGSASKMFRVTGRWSVPRSLRDCVLLLEPSRKPEARRREEAIVPEWTPTQQVVVALGTADAHRYQREILDALAKAGDVNALGGILVDALRDSQWLNARSKPVAPVSILNLPDEVAHEARSLERGGSIPSFVSRQDLPSDVRDHPGFSMLASQILPCRSKSLKRLASLLDGSPLIGRLGSSEDYPLDEFRALSEGRADLALPGWPLLAAVLRSVERDIDAQRIVDKRDSATEQHERLVIDHLNALASVSSTAPESALAAYRHAIRAMVRWSEPFRRAVFSKTRVPTQTGDWRTGREVIPQGQGLSRDSVLDHKSGQILGSDERVRRPSGDQTDEHLASQSNLGGWIIRRGCQHLHDLDQKAFEQQVSFLNWWFDRIPTRLVVVYLALLGTREFLGRLVQGRAAKHDIDTWWEETRDKLDLNDEHRLLVDIHHGTTIRAVSLSGDVVDLPPATSSEELLRGNGHKADKTIYIAVTGDQRHVSKLRIRDEDIRGLSGGNSDAPKKFRRFVETVAVDCVELWKEPVRQALARLLDRAIKVNQTTLRDTRAIMQDELHSTLSGLKPERDSVIWKALNDFRDHRDRATALGKSDSDIAGLKADLWNVMETPEAQVELLRAMRSKIEEYGYSADRIVFELLQNADDAYHQLHDRSDVPCFVLRVRLSKRRGFQAIHWGRAINDLGNNPDEGRRRGYGRDLHNMLLMNFSEKRRSDGVTGQFGLGFKTVHMLSDSVGIASRLLAVRTQGGLIPRPWPQGANASDRERRDGQQATIIDVPFVEGRRQMGREAVKTFREAMVWLPLFARQIRRIEFDDSKLTTVERRDGEKIADGARVVTVLGDSTERLLKFDVRDGYSLVLRLDRDGPVGFPSALPRLWNLAPLQESISAGCLLNGPFPLDPGRGRLAGTTDRQRAIMEKRGDAYGDCLRSLYDAAMADWDAFCKALDLRGGHEGQHEFWSRLFDIVAADLGDSPACNLHGVDRGYGYLATRCPVVPTRLPGPWGELITASKVRHRTAGALTDENVQREVLRWPVVASLTGSLVARPVADQLRKLGFEPVEDLSVAKALERQLGEDTQFGQKASPREHPRDGRVDAVLAGKLGKLINMKTIARAPLDQERTAILAVARQARFRCEDGEWRSVRRVSARLGDDEDLLCEFAPGSALLDVAYQGDGLEFFRVARRESGYGPQAKDLHCWVREANDRERQRAALRYLIAGRQRRALAKEVQSDRPLWLPCRPELFSHRLLDGWPDSDKQDLVRRLYPKHTRVVIERPVRGNGGGTETAGNVLLAIHDWWTEGGQQQRRHYEQHVYPESFDVFPFQDSSASWFTLFAIARFQNLGRVIDAHHRTFIDQAYNDGWWRELALTEGNEVAVDLLDAWSDPEQPDHAYRPWRNTLVDLYSIARGLDAYSAVMRRLPRIIREKGRVSLRQLLVPAQSDVHMHLGTVAAPIDSPIGFGINWMIRELVRHGFYSQDDAEVLAPYCWSARARVRRLLDHLGSNLGNDADMDASRRVWDFIRHHLGEGQADFGGDFDLPLHLITLKKNAECLNDIFRETGVAPLELPQWTARAADY